METSDKLGKNRVLALFIVIFALIPVMLSCTFPQETKEPSQVDPINKGNPKLDSQLNRLIQAEKYGEADLFAQQNEINLLGGSIRVIIECATGQIDEATEAAESIGASIETSYDGLLQATVPIRNLDTLTETESVRFIRLPQQPLLDTGDVK